MKVLTIEKKAKQSPPNRSGKPAGPGATATKPEENSRSFDKAKAGRKWYGKKNTY
jgi:hypothetical protein